jgi:hypothetical protein
VYNNIIYRYKYVTDFMDDGIKLLNREMKETNNGHTGYFVEDNGLFFCNISYSSYDTPSFKF